MDAICARGQVRVGMSAEPFRPFVFPAIYTDEGVRVTGLDVSLVQAITAALSDRCGGETPVVPYLELVRFRDLFVELTEGKLDFFISAKSMNVVSPIESGLAYSVPYYYDGGVIGIARRDVATRLRETLRGKSAGRDLDAFKSALTGFRVGVQSARSPHRYAEANLPEIRIVLCDSLPAAFESLDPAIDVILGKRPILEQMIKSGQKEWEVLKDDSGRHWLLTREHYAIVLAEDDHALRWFINDLLFRMEQDGRLASLRHRWIEEDYAYPRRAASEGLPFDANKMPQHYDQGSCRATAR
jgi:ABC-type amino acid transport substrate-binding protein